MERNFITSRNVRLLRLLQVRRLSNVFAGKTGKISYCYSENSYQAQNRQGSAANRWMCRTYRTKVQLVGRKLLNFFGSHRKYYAPGFIYLLISMLIIGCGKTLSGTSSGEDDGDTNNSTDNSIFYSGYLTSKAVVSSAPISSNNDGYAVFEFDQETNSLYGEVEVNASNVTGVRLHRGIAGKNGTSQIDFIINAADTKLWEMPGAITLDDDAAAAFLQGEYYVQVSTSEYQGGELRAQLLGDSQEVFVNTITAEQITTSESTSANSGVSYLTVDYNTGEIKSIARFYNGYVPSGLSVRAAVAGQQGESRFDLVNDLSDTSMWGLADTVTLDDGDISQLSSGSFYIRADTENYPDGELRGQILPDHMELRILALTGDGVIPQSGSTATGKAIITINFENRSLQGVLSYSGITPTSVLIIKINNINNPNSKMELVDWIQDVDVWTIPSGSQLDKNDLNSLGMGRLFIFVFSDEYPLGEIGGML